uniref:Uncharacterized protein n=1 Tax=Aegilops tauschii subsp. strangulata TaxID=200361 RepID=A0A453DH91_AEGTS
SPRRDAADLITAAAVAVPYLSLNPTSRGRGPPPPPQSGLRHHCRHRRSPSSSAAGTSSCPVQCLAVGSPSILPSSELWIQPESRQLRAAFSKLKKLSIQGIYVEFDLLWTINLLEAAPTVEIFGVEVLILPVPFLDC